MKFSLAIALVLTLCRNNSMAESYGSDLADYDEHDGFHAYDSKTGIANADNYVMAAAQSCSNAHGQAGGGYAHNRGHETTAASSAEAEATTNGQGFGRTYLYPSGYGGSYLGPSSFASSSADACASAGLMSGPYSVDLSGFADTNASGGSFAPGSEAIAYASGQSQAQAAVNGYAQTPASYRNASSNAKSGASTSANAAAKANARVAALAKAVGKSRSRKSPCHKKPRTYPPVKPPCHKKPHCPTEPPVHPKPPCHKKPPCPTKPPVQPKTPCHKKPHPPVKPPCHKKPPCPTEPPVHPKPPSHAKPPVYPKPPVHLPVKPPCPLPAPFKPPCQASPQANGNTKSPYSAKN